MMMSSSMVMKKDNFTVLGHCCIIRYMRVHHPASQRGVKLPLDIGRQARGICTSLARGEESLQVLRDHGVEHRLAGIPGCVGGNGWRHTSPHG